MLMADPIIQAMAEEVRGLGRDDLMSWTFTNNTLDEYRRRGGIIDSHIGGPAEAIRRILDARTDSD